MPFRRVMKQTIDKVMANKEVKGFWLTLVEDLLPQDVIEVDNFIKRSIIK
jgi:hypothetical protein